MLACASRSSHETLLHDLDQWRVLKFVFALELEREGYMKRVKLLDFLSLEERRRISDARRESRIRTKVRRLLTSNANAADVIIALNTLADMNQNASSRTGETCSGENASCD